MFFISMSSYCHSTTERLDTNDGCMSGGSWACCGGTTKERGHCGCSKWGNSSHHLTVGSPPFSVRNCNCFCIVSRKTLPYDSTTMTLLVLFHSCWVVLHWKSRVSSLHHWSTCMYHLRMNSCVIATPHHVHSTMVTHPHLPDMHGCLVKQARVVVFIVQCLLSFTFLPDWPDSSHGCILWRSPSYCGETTGSRGPAWPAEEGTANSVGVGSDAINST